MNPPTRLLDVGSSSLDNVFLIEPERGSPDLQSLSPTYRYATMSHCWGSFPVMTLTTETASDLAAGFQSSIMPHYFQHAVTVCRSLGIRYLWIDSLCIYQDTEEDWNRECANMGAIYQGSVCTIAATAASNSQEGCFRERPPWLVQHCIVHIDLEGLFLGDYILEFPTYWDGILKGSPLFQRAWVLQERVLSPRFLHFGKTQLIWEGLELEAFEKYLTVLSDSMPCQLGPLPFEREDTCQFWRQA